MTFDLVIHYRHRGWRWPLRPGDSVEVWSVQDKVAELPAELVQELLVYHLRGVALADAVHQCAVSRALPRLRGVNGRRLRGLG